MVDLILQPGRDRSVRRRHPWVLSGSVSRLEGEARAGDLVTVRSDEGEVLGHGHYSPHSQIRVRMLDFDKREAGDEGLLRRVTEAVERRRGHPDLVGCEAHRLVNAEGDGLPGLIADRYGEVVVMRVGTAGMARRSEMLARRLAEATGVPCVLERAEARALRREGWPMQGGARVGAAPTAPVAVTERGRHHLVDLVHGQKTGFYLDQRETRSLVERLAPGRRVLDLFCYTGGFALAAARAGAAAVTAVDSSKPALELGARSLALEPGARPVDWLPADAFRFLREGDERFDLIVVDPPPLARRKADTPRACRAIRDLLLHGLRRSAPGAQLFVFSCSHHVGADLLRKVAFGASVDVGREVRVQGELGAPSDHPVALSHPEGRYLSGLRLEVGA